MLLDAATDHILTWAGELTPKGFHAALVEFAHRLDPDLVDDVEAKKRRRVFLDATATLDGYVHVAGLLDPVTGGMFLHALESARRAGTDADAAADAKEETPLSRMRMLIPPTRAGRSANVTRKPSTASSPPQPRRPETTACPRSTAPGPGSV
jgi:hypothetical protein